MSVPTDASHRPWPVPDRPWLVWMSWRKLLFAHWPVDPDRVRPHIPDGLELQTWDGRAWIGVVPFDMVIRPRLLPRLGRLSHFLELNVRTYVSAEGKPGVWFFSLDAESWPAVRAARLLFRLPYFDADMSLSKEGGVVRYESRRIHRNAAPARFQGSYRPTGKPQPAEPGTLEQFLTERYCLYAAHRNRLLRSEVHHEPWPLQPAEAEIRENSMGAGPGFPLRNAPALCHYADRLNVVAWLPEVVR